MKIHPIVLVLVICSWFLSTKSYSQNFRSIFGNNSASWSIIQDGACDYIVSNIFETTGDTVINSKSYKIISGHGYLREDTVSGKVWFYNVSLQKDFLVMNMNLQLGDSAYLYLQNNDSVLIIADSVYYESSIKHIRFNSWITMCSYSEKITFIEGSGPNTGFGYQGVFYSGSAPNTFMLCHYKDGIKVSGNTLFSDSCTLSEVSVPKNNRSSDFIKISPNPAVDFISVDSPVIDYATISIYTTEGRLVKTATISTQNPKIQITDLKNGFYSVIVKAKDFVSIDKLVIQK